MQKALLIAEKPDLMRKIEEVYDNHKQDFPFEIDFRSQRGHLVTLKNPAEMDPSLKAYSWDTLPIDPKDWGGWQYKVIEDKKVGNYMTSRERYDDIKKALHSGKYDFVINAGDPDQEGELLVRTVLDHMHNRLPIKRFWSNDLTEGHIKNALLNLREDETDPMLVNLLQAAYARQHSDYRYGMNISRAATMKMNVRVACGRVKTPLLAIVCRREGEIRNFKEKTVYGVKAAYTEGFTGTLFDPADKEKEEQEEGEEHTGTIWFDRKEDAEALIRTLGKSGKILSCESETSRTYAPPLFKLATLQVEAGKMGFGAADTLAIVQRLYERKLLSYPRTDCEYLSSQEDFVGILSAVRAVPEFAPYIGKLTSKDVERVRSSKKWINDKALEKSGHSALRPTTDAVNWEALTEEEQKIYALVCRRFVAMFLPPLVQNKTQLVADIDGHMFKSTGKTLIDAGYTTIFGTKFTDMQIPIHKEGDLLQVEKYDCAEKTSKCPKPFTSADLIAVCENPIKYVEDPEIKKLGKKLKIGTQATRANIIQQLIEKDKYLCEKKEGKKSYLHPTGTGGKIIVNLGDCEICKVDMTGIWEEKLEMIRSGKLTLGELEEDMRADVINMLKYIREKDMTPLAERKGPLSHKIGDCPCPGCGGTLYAGEKNVHCSNWKTKKCHAGVFFDQKEYTITEQDYLLMLQGRKLNKVTKKGETIEIYIDPDTGRTVLPQQKTETPYTCPACGSRVYENKLRFYCEKKENEECTFSIPKVIAQREIESAQIEKFFATGATDLINGFVSKKGGKFSAQIVYDKEKKTAGFKFPEAVATESKYICPFCQKNMKDDGRRLSCDCGASIFKYVCGHQLTDDELESLLTKGKTKLIKKMKSKKGSEFDARIVLDKEKKSTKFAFE